MNQQQHLAAWVAANKDVISLAGVASRAGLNPSTAAAVCAAPESPRFRRATESQLDALTGILKNPPFAYDPEDNNPTTPA